MFCLEKKISFMIGGGKPFSNLYISVTRNSRVFWCIVSRLFSVKTLLINRKILNSKWGKHWGETVETPLEIVETLRETCGKHHGKR